MARGPRKNLVVRECSRKTLLKDCDKLWSLLIITRDKKICQACGRPGNNPHHIFSRKHMGTRHDPENGITICWACHMHKAHSDPEMFRDFIISRIGEDRFFTIKRRALSVTKVDLQLTRVYLIQELKKLGDYNGERIGVGG